MRCPLFERPHILISYAYVRSNTFNQYLDNWTVMVDSGAFTAHRTGKEVDLDEYGNWLRDYSAHPALYDAMQLDVIGD